MEKHEEPHDSGTASRLNWLRAAVLGANDGVVSVASIVVGVAAANQPVGVIITAGVAGLSAGALSMAAGEYVSVSTQRDTERALIEKEKRELIEQPEFELNELTKLYEAKGLTHDTARHVAEELTKHDALAAHLEVELNIDPNDLTNPWHAAFASAAAFISGGIIPLIAVALPPEHLRMIVTFASVIVALVITGVVSAYAGGANKTTATIRNVLGGVFAMAVTYGVGLLFGVAGI